MSSVNSGTFSVFPAFEKRMVKFSVKTPWRSDIVLLVSYKSYSTFCTSKCKINVLCIAIRMTHQWLTLIPIWHC